MKLKQLEGGRRKRGDVSAANAPVVAPWDITERQDSQWLEALGFRPKKLLQPDWTESDLSKFYKGLKDWKTGARIVGTLTMGMYYWLSHHIMERRFSPKACKRLAQSQLRSLQRRGNMHNMSAPSPQEEGGASDVDSDTKSDSDDEAPLQRGVN